MAMMPPPPPGFEIEPMPRRGKLSLDTYKPKGDIHDLGEAPPLPDGFQLEPTGEVVDGDTIRLDGGRNGRLSGFDAWESDQLGYRPVRGPLRIGEQATTALDGLVTPQTNVRGIGKESYNRPVVIARNGEADAALPMLRSGHGLAAPEYLDANDPRRGEYLEAERQSRINMQGGHGAQTLTPEAQRKADRWNIKLRPDEEIAFNSDLPDFRPEFQRLSTDEEQDYFGFLASKSGDQNFSQSDLDAYWKGKGKAAEQADPKFIESIRKGEKFGAIDYSSWDAQTLRDFNMTSAFAGMRPEIRQEYNALLSSPDVTPEAVEKWGQAYGMTFDPRDLKAFAAEKAKGGNPAIPIPIINPGDGAPGAAGRGFIDTLGFAGEAGGLIDAVAPEWAQDAAQSITGGSEGFKHRETIYNSERPFWDIVENNWRQNEAILDHDETRHPYARAGGQIVGGVFIPGSAGVRGVSGFAKAGAIEGGIYGFGSGDGSLGTRLMNVPGNAAIGATAAATIGKGGELVTDMVGRFARTLGFRGERRALSAADQQRVEAFAGELQRQVGDDATDVGEDQMRAAFDAADNAATQAAARETLPPGFVMVEPPASVANMDAEDAVPSLSSPRIPDTIDVNATRTRRMMEGPTEAMINAASARVEPGDVLPRPANEIQSLDEAAAISEGLYPEVRAPRERDYLETRQFPSRANPDNMLNRRGPLDLAAYVRAEGGVADFRGELKAAGLSNAARKGDDFAGGDNRLGPLLNDDGSTLDDMAQRAWEAGYFPDHATRPTIDEFVTALGDTYRGVNRTFRPDDFAEIDAFNAARDQRLAVERARQEGAPLADDLGQPATLDDVVANTPPATAYDDWNNAVVSKVGNIDVRKLESPQDIGQALKVADNIAGGFDAAKRGKISFAETQALAQDLGMTADDLLARRKGQAFSAEEAYAARAILAKSGNELVNMAKRVQSLGDDPGSEALAAFRKALVRHTAIQEQVSGMTAEAGRALSAFRMAADSRDIPGRVLEGLANAGGGSGRLKDAAERIIDLERDPANLNRFIEKVSKPKFADRAQEIWYNYLLSGPQTHMVNMLSNTMTALGQIPEHAVAAGIGATRRAIGGRDASDLVMFSELGARSLGLLQGTKEGIREFARAFRTGEASDFVTKMESQTQKAVQGIKGEILRVPTRLLTAEDELFKAMARRMELSGLAVRQAAKEGLKGKEGKARVAALMANPPDEIMAKVLDYGRYLTFQRPLGDGLAGTLSRYSQNHPLIKAVLPFIRTPTNLIKFTAERSPLAPLVKEWRKDFGAGGARRDLAVAKVMVGSGIGAVIAELAAKGVITGSEPGDDNQRGLMMANGWQPYSIKIGDRYYSYRRLDPFAMTFGTAADLATMGEGMSDKQREKGAALWTASVVANLASRTWLSGVSDALEALQDPERYSGNFIKRLVGSATVPTGSAQVARIVDPTMRETPDIAAYMSSRMPGQSDELLPKRDVWGRPIVSEGGVGPDILSPIWTSTDKKDPITREVLRVGATISKPQKGDMTPQQYDRMQKLSGSVGRKWIEQLIASPEYQEKDEESQADDIGDVMKRARKAAKASVLTGEPIPDDRPVKKARGRSAPPPPGFVVDPLPDGFVLEQ
jgi:endonuclease YncB( thermonuclease family)